MGRQILKIEYALPSLGSERTNREQPQAGNIDEQTAQQRMMKPDETLSANHNTSSASHNTSKVTTKPDTSDILGSSHD